MAKKKAENQTSELQSAVLARMDESSVAAPRGTIPGLDLIKGAVVSFLVEQVISQAGDALEANRDEVIRYASEKAGELTSMAVDGAQGLLDSLRDALGGE